MIINELYCEINKLTSKIIEKGLSVREKFPSIKNNIISWEKATNISKSLKNINYIDKYKELHNNGNYNFILLDGALIQLAYTCSRRKIESHRLAYYPNPFLLNYSDTPEEYEDYYYGEEIYADILEQYTCKFPLRFDYMPNSHVDKEHPQSHLHLGEYENCRIPVCSPIRPKTFLYFILRNFYYKAFIKHFRDDEVFTNIEEFTITDGEKKILHFNIL